MLSSEGKDADGASIRISAADGRTVGEVQCTCRFTEVSGDPARPQVS